MVEYTKIGNRYYGIEGGVLYKATYDDEKKEYMVCGEYNSTTFAAMESSLLDRNTADRQTEIITTLGI